MKRSGAIGLMAIGLQQGVVLAVGERHLLAVVQGDHRMLDVGVGEHRVHVVRDVAETARERQQVLALFVEHVFLLVIARFRSRSGRPPARRSPASTPGRWRAECAAALGLTRTGLPRAFAKRICTFCRRAFARYRADPGHRSTPRNTNSVRQLPEIVAKTKGFQQAIGSSASVPRSSAYPGSIRSNSASPLSHSAQPG